jgi:phage terminase large subunit-like protein
MAQAKRDLVDVLTTSTGARRQPLVIYLTTAGWNRTSICFEKYNYAKQVCEGALKDPAFFPIIFEISDPDANWFTPETWALANPNLGISISEEYLARECDRAMESPAFENTFKTFHLNMWVEAESRFFPMHDWDSCPTEIDPESLHGAECYIGCDMASKEDIAALCAVFPPTRDRPEYVVLGRYFIPQEAMFERIRRHGVPYDSWQREGRVIATPGPTIDPERIYEQVEQWWDLYDVREFIYDPHGAEWIVAKVESSFGVEVSVMISGAVTKISGPIMTLYEKVRQRQINFGGCPVIKWMGSNTTVEFNKEGLVKPVKPQSHLKIDGVIATAIALSRAALSEFVEEPQSVYEKRGPLVFEY